MNKTNTITLTISHEGMNKDAKGRYTIPKRMTRRVFVDGREVYMDQETFDLWANDDSILRQFELWAIKAEQSVPQLKNRDKSVGQFKKFLRSVGQTRRKVLHTQRYWSSRVEYLSDLERVYEELGKVYDILDGLREQQSAQDRDHSTDKNRQPKA